MCCSHENVKQEVHERRRRVVCCAAYLGGGGSRPICGDIPSAATCGPVWASCFVRVRCMSRRRRSHVPVVWKRLVRVLCHPGWALGPCSWRSVEVFFRTPVEALSYYCRPRVIIVGKRVAGSAMPVPWCRTGDRELIWQISPCLSRGAVLRVTVLLGGYWSWTCAALGQVTGLYSLTPRDASARGTRSTQSPPTNWAHSGPR